MTVGGRGPGLRKGIPPGGARGKEQGAGASGPPAGCLGNADLALVAPLGGPGGAGAAVRQSVGEGTGEEGEEGTSRAEGRPAASLPRSLTRSLPGCGCCNGGNGGCGGSSSGSSLEASIEVRQGWTEAAGRSGRTDGRRRGGLHCTGIQAPSRVAGGAGRAKPMEGGGSWGTLEQGNPWERG